MQASEGTDGVAKKQKNALLDEGVCELVDILQKLSGATFPRIVTAALMQYIFDGLQDADPDNLPGPDPLWMNIAVRIERGELSVDDVPSALLDAAIEGKAYWVKYYDRDEPTQADAARLKECRAESRALFKARMYWNNDVKDFGGARKAIEQILTGRFAPPSK